MKIIFYIDGDITFCDGGAAGLEPGWYRADLVDGKLSAETSEMDGPFPNLEKVPYE